LERIVIARAFCRAESFRPAGQHEQQRRRQRQPQPLHFSFLFTENFCPSGFLFFYYLLTSGPAFK